MRLKPDLKMHLCGHTTNFVGNCDRSNPTSSTKSSGGGHKTAEVAQTQAIEEPTGESLEQSKTTATCISMHRYT